MTRFQPPLAAAAAACGAVLLGCSLGGIASVDATLQAASSTAAVRQERTDSERVADRHGDHRDGHRT